MKSKHIWLAGLVLLSGSVAYGQTSYPMITHAHPVAVQRGKTTEIAVQGQQNFGGAYQVLFEGQGVTGEMIGVDAPMPMGRRARRATASVKVKVTPVADVMPGAREFRIATSSGLSSVGQLVIVDESVIVETSANNTRDKATPITVPCVACGKIEAAEDVDYFKFTGVAGQTVTFEVECARLQDKIHDLQNHADPMLTLFDANGKELAGNDDFFFADSMFNYKFAQTGDYYLQLRDSKYEGDPRWVYALTVTNKPYISHVFPLAVAAGQDAELEPIGSAKQLQAKVKLPAPPPGDEVREVQLDVAGIRSNPVAVVVHSSPACVEQEPNDAADKATRVAIPSYINGRIGVKRDLDHYIFAAKKGQPIQFEVKARRFNTPLISGIDASLDILDGKGNVLSSLDDNSAFSKDPLLVFTPPADGDYILRVRDLLSKGGEHFVYAVEAEPAAPDFTLLCDDDKAMIAPTGCNAWYVHVTRTNGFSGPVAVTVNGLPKGVSATPLVIPPTMTQGLLVLAAAANAPKGAANVQVIGTATAKDAAGKERTLVRVAAPYEEIYTPGGGRGRLEVRMQSVAVTEQADIAKIEVSPKTITLKPGEEVKIDVAVKRRSDYTGNVGLDIKLQHLGGVFGNPLPPGVNIVEGKSKTLLGKESKGHITLKAEPSAAAIENVPISVLAQVSVNFVVKISYSSEVVPLTVRK